MHFYWRISCFLETIFLFVFHCVCHFLQHTFWQAQNQSFWFYGESICNLAFLCSLRQEYCPVLGHYKYNLHHEWFSFDPLIGFQFWMHSLVKKAHFFWKDIFQEWNQVFLEPCKTKAIPPKVLKVYLLNLLLLDWTLKFFHQESVLFQCNSFQESCFWNDHLIFWLALRCQWWFSILYHAFSDAMKTLW